jgi:[acyl-carrier-protein] S-malonyltransferase
MMTTNPQLACVFPGQGSQALGMLAELAAQHPGIRATFSEASDGAGIDLWALAQDGPAAELDRTENTQPALLAAGVAVWRAWLEAGGPRPAFLAGHSLGEYAALVCAGALTLHDAAGLVAERGRLMQAAVPSGAGAMAAVLGGEPAQIEQVCAEVAGDQVVAPANFNAPGQIVIAGHAAAVDRALARLADLGVRKAIRLAVSVPSHCALMRDAATQLERRLDSMTWSTPTIPVIRNVDATASTDVADARAALARQLYEPVRWSDCVAALAAAGVTCVLECGPGKVLTGLARRIDRTLDARPLGMPEEFAAALAETGIGP